MTTQRQRLRKTGLLCLHCLRNIAFYRAAQDARPWPEPQQFWRTASNNFLDVAVLEWCKIFVDEKAKHHWKKLVGKHEQFEAGLLEKLRITNLMFQYFSEEIRVYRNKFVAHLDDENEMHIPNLVPAVKSAQFLYQWLHDAEDDCNAFGDAPQNSVTFYREFLNQGRAVCDASKSA